MNKYITRSCNTGGRFSFKLRRCTFIKWIWSIVEFGSVGASLDHYWYADGACGSKTPFCRLLIAPRTKANDSLRWSCEGGSTLSIQPRRPREREMFIHDRRIYNFDLRLTFHVALSAWICLQIEKGLLDAFGRLVIIACSSGELSLFNFHRPYWIDRKRKHIYLNIDCVLWISFLSRNFNRQMWVVMMLIPKTCIGLNALFNIIILFKFFLYKYSALSTGQQRMKWNSAIRNGLKKPFV